MDVQGIWDPVFYVGDAPMLDDDSDPSGKKGAKASITIDVNNRPQKLTAIRVVVAYQLFDFANFQEGNSFLTDYLDRIKDVEDQMLMTTDLSQSNIIVSAAHVRGFQGGVRSQGGVIYHPLPTPMLWRGGNNITLDFTQLVDYPTVPLNDGETFDVAPHIYVVTEGCQMINDIVPPKGPPSTGWAD